jgi:hypothetical protein
MITNIGVIDGVLRFVLGVGLLAYSDGRFGDYPPHDLALAAWIAGVLLAATGLFRSCPVYALLGTDSCAVYPGHDGQPSAPSALDKGEPTA